MPYTTHFRLLAEPFGLTPDPAFLYLSPGHGEALAALRIGLLGRRGLAAMVGEIGTGKTTLLHALLGDLEPTMRTAYVWNTLRPFDDLLHDALADFGVPYTGSPTTALVAFLERCAAEGTTATLVIDEAQNLGDDAFETLRLLVNFETHETKLLNVVLVGQPELAATLRRPHLRQVGERVAVRCSVRPLGWAESRRYVEHRLRRAGRDATLFTWPALRMLTLAARGIPRRINILAHNACVFAYGRGTARVTLGAVLDAVRERRGLAPGRPWGRAAAAVTALVALAAFATWQISVHLRRATASVRATAPAPPLVVAPGGRLAGVPDGIVLPPGSARPTSGARTTDGGHGPPAATVGDRAPAAADEPAPAAPAPDGGGSSRTDAPEPAADPPAGVAPEPAAAPPDTESWIVVRVRRGTTLNELAMSLYGQSLYGEGGPALLARIRRLNPHVRDVDRIFAGDTLRMPRPTRVAGRKRTP